MAEFVAILEAAPAHFVSQVGALLLAPGSHFSLLSLLSALAVAALVLAARRGGRGLRTRTLVRALFPRSLFASASCRADLALMLFNMIVAAALVGGLLLSTAFVAQKTGGGLALLLGASPALALPPILIGLLATGALYLAYEFAYWLDHWLMHRFAFFWAFHRVHHSAERLTPITNFRVHPVDTLIFYNLVALFTGVTGGLLAWGFGPGHEWTIGGANLFVLASVFLLLHLQHSELWIHFPGRWGRLFLSPAHHQVHHSAHPHHFNRNFGASLAIFDRLFGTLHVPGPRREVTRFGLGEEEANPHAARTMLLKPLTDAGAIVARAARLPKPGGDATVPVDGSTARI